MVKCVYCGCEEPPYKGIHRITNDGAVQYFCSSKCRKNALKLRRDRRRLKWTEAYRIALAKTRAAAAREAESQENKPVEKQADTTTQTAQAKKKK